MTKIKLIHLFATLALVFTSACQKTDNKKPTVAPKTDLTGDVTLGTDLGAKSASASGAVSSGALGGSTSAALGIQTSTALGLTTSGTSLGATSSGALGGTTSTAVRPAAVGATTSSAAVGNTTSGSKMTTLNTAAAGQATSGSLTTKAKSGVAVGGATSGAQGAAASSAVTSMDTVQSVPDKTIKDIQKWQINGIKVLDASLLTVIKPADHRILFENFLTLKERGAAIIKKRKFGLMCDFDSTDNLKVGDKLSLVETKQSEQKTAVNGVEVESSVLVLVFTNQDKSKKLTMNCTYRGEIRERDLVDNLYDVVEFKNAAGNYVTDTQVKLDYKAITEKTMSFRVVDAEKLNKIVIADVQSNAKNFAMTRGALVEESQSVVNVATGREKQACAIIGKTMEKFLNGMVFKQIAIKPMDEDLSNNFAKMQIYYAIDDDNQMAIECALRRNGVGPEVIFETFAGVLVFGEKDVKPAAAGTSQNAKSGN